METTPTNQLNHKLTLILVLKIVFHIALLGERYGTNLWIGYVFRKRTERIITKQKHVAYENQIYTH